MNIYEGLFIVSPTLGKEDTEKALSYIKDQITKHKGAIEKTEDLGKRRLAYRLNKQREGQYYVLNFKLEPNQVKEIEHAYKLSDSILRVLITKKDS